MTLDHFVKVEVIPRHLHVTENGLKSIYPNIGLLTNRRIETPVVVTVIEFWKCNGVAIQFTFEVFVGVL